MNEDHILSDPKLLVREELKRMGMDLDSIDMPARVYIAMPGIFNYFIQHGHVDDSIIPIAGGVYSFKLNPAIGLIKSNIGSPGVAIQVEDLIAGGVQEFIQVGFAGGIHSDLSLGQIVITTGAYSETGISSLYGIQSEIVHASQSLVDTCREMLTSQTVAYQVGLHWTTDAGYLETWGKVKKYSSLGALCVEMEGAGVFSVAAYRGVKSAAMYIITDILSGSGWSLGESGVQVDEAIARLCECIAASN